MRSLAVLGSLAVLAACGADRGPFDLPLSGTPVEECPADGWCWVRGRSISVRTGPGLNYAIGSEGTFLIWDDDHWIDASVPTHRRLVSARVKREDDLWVIDDEPSAWHFDGTDWAKRRAVDVGWDGDVWRLFAPPKLLTFIDATLPRDQGWREDDGQIYFAKDGEWLPTLADPFADTAAPSLWGMIPPTLWAGGDAELAWGSGPNDVYRASRSTGRKLEHFDGQTWTVVLDEEVLDLNGSGGEAWVVTASGLLRSVGGGFTPVPIPAELGVGEAREIYGIPEGLLVLTRDALLFFDGSWAVLRQSYGLKEVAGSSLDDVWLVVHPGQTGQVEHFDGAAWTLHHDFLLYNSDLTTSDTGETWLFNGLSPIRLGSSDPQISKPPDISEASFWVGAGALWVLSGARAQRYPLPSP